MRIGFDAKRAFLNSSGLGNYSRYVISGLSGMFPDNEYLLYTPGRKNYAPPDGTRVLGPGTAVSRLLPSLWRTLWLAGDAEADAVDLFHGLSNEIPFGSSRRSFRTCVTIHDLIFLRMPHLYPATDRSIYRLKTSLAVRHADHIIATSEQTKRDLVEILSADPERISVVYQGCQPRFYNPAGNLETERVKKKYDLPEQFLFYVGTIEKRKNLLRVAEALSIGNLDIPVIAAGRKTAYATEVENFAVKKKLNHFRLIGEVPAEDLPAMYQLASVFIYPSIYEGFGIPVLEALNSGTPVITSSGGCLEESGGEGALLVNPYASDEIADAIVRILDSQDLREALIRKGRSHALQFRDEITIPRLYDVYKKCLQ